MVNEKPKFKIFDPVADIAEKFNFYIKVVVGVLVVAVLTMLFMAITILLYVWHFNSAVYKEYSGKIDTLETIQKSNQLLFDSNKQNQEIIIKQQKQIKELLKKK